MPSANLELLRITASLLKPILHELVFVGGCTTELLITDPAAGEIRATRDVDAIAEITSYARYASFGEKLHQLGFVPDDSEGAPMCRWRSGEIRLDLMPLDEKILGFSNRWYREAMETATRHQIAEGIEINVVAPIYFCATKIEAFNGRGHGDYLSSHDLEDLIAVIDGRPELVAELGLAPSEVRLFVRDTFKEFLESPQFMAALPGHLLPDEGSQARLGILVKRLTDITLLN